MDIKAQYELARAKARETRAKYGLISPRVMVSDLKRIYKAEGIDRVDYYDGFKGTRIKGAYFNDHIGSSVMVNKKLIGIIDPKVFTLAHELKHHLMDEVHSVSLCSDDNEHALMESTADAFASEFIYPVSLFCSDLQQMGIIKGRCAPKDIVSLKHETKTTLSHAGLALRAQRLGYAGPYTFNKIRWEKLRDEMFPEYSYFRKPRRSAIAR